MSLVRFRVKIRESELNKTNWKRWRWKREIEGRIFFKKRGIQVISTFSKTEWFVWVCVLRKTQSVGGFFEPPKGESDNKIFSFKCFP